jgi:hypothetical protein
VVGVLSLKIVFTVDFKAVEHVVDPGLLPILPWRTGLDHLSIFSPEHYTVSTSVQIHKSRLKLNWLLTNFSPN